MHELTAIAAADPLADEALVPALTPDTSVRVYEYGIRMDKEAVEHAVQQVIMARLLYNDIVAAMRRVYDEMQAFVLERCDDAGRAAHMRVTTLNEAFDAAKADNDEAAMKRVAQARREAWRDLAASLSVARKAHAVDLRQLFYSRVGLNRRCETYALRCKAVDAGLGWATGNDVLARALTAWKSSMKQGRPPRFSRGDEKDQDCLSLQFTAAGGVDTRR